MIQIYYSKSNQSMYDICLNTYQALEYLVKLCVDNGVESLAYLPKPNTAFVWDDALVQNQAKTVYTYATAQILNSFVLDRYSKAICAYSLTSLYENYNGYCIRIRRSSDNSEKDIGLMPDGSFDITTFETFVGASTAYVVKWYDQTGNGYHWAQTTAAYQPKCDGVQILFAPSTGVAGSFNYLEQGNIFGNSAARGTQYHTFLVAQNNPPLNSTNSFKTLIDYDGEGGALSKGWGIRLGNLNTNPTNIQAWNAGGTGSLYVNGSKYLVNQVPVPSPLNWRVYDLRINGFNTKGNYKFRIGGSTDVQPTDWTWTGQMKELIIYNRDMTEVQYDIMTDIMQKYGIS